VATLVTLDGRRLRRKPPGSSYIGGGGLAGPFPPLWSDGETNEPAGWHLASYNEIYETQPVVAAAVNKLSRQMATLPLKVYQRGADDSRKRVKDHPLAGVVETPCPRRSTVDLVEWIALPLLVHGNSLVFKYRSGPQEPVSALYPLDWAHASAYAQQGGPVEWWGTTQFGEERYVKAEDVIHFAWSASGSELGVSPLKHLGVTLKIEDAAQRHTVSSFRKGVNPSLAVILHPEARFDDEARAVMRKAIESIHAGPDKQGGVFIAGQGSDVKTLSHSAREAELIAVRELTLREVCMVYDVKPTVLGDLTHGTYSNVSELNKDLYKQTLRPWMRKIEATINSQLVQDEFGDVFVEFDTSEVLKGDPTERFEAYKTQIESGQLTPAQAIELENRPTKDLPPEAFKLYLPKNNLRAIDAPPEPQLQPAAVAQNEQEESEDDRDTGTSRTA
jgi:HK97 family phage portal protein